MFSHSCLGGSSFNPLPTPKRTMRNRPQEQKTTNQTVFVSTDLNTVPAQRLRESRSRENQAASRLSNHIPRTCPSSAEVACSEGARLRLLDVLLSALLRLDLNSSAARNPKIGMKLQRKVTKTPNQRKVKVDTLMNFLNHQLARITKDADQLMLPRDNARRLINCWSESPFLSKDKLGAYKDPMRRNIQMMIAASVIALANDSFTDHLRSSAPLKWTMPERLNGIDLKNIPNVPPEVAKRIVQSCIDQLMKLVRSLPENPSRS